MRIAIMSDSHDNIWNLRKAISIIDRRKPELIIHCGDFVAPFVLWELEEARIPVHGVFGNNDGDRYTLTQLALTELSFITLHGITGEVDLDGYKIGFAHERVIAEGLVMRGEYNLVCFGHSHEYFIKKINETVLLNPGEIMGKDGIPGFCLVDTVSERCERILM